MRMAGVFPAIWHLRARMVSCNAALRRRAGTYGRARAGDRAGQPRIKEYGLTDVDRSGDHISQVGGVEVGYLD